MFKETPQGTAARLFQLASEPMCMTDAEGVVRAANPAAAALLGMPPERLEGLAIAQLVLDEDAAAASRLFGDLDDGHPRASAVLRSRVGTHHVRSIRWSVTRDPESGLCYAVAWDVTEKRRAQARYKTATEASPTALIMVDADGRIVLANSAALQLLHFGPDELVGQRVEILVPEELRDAHPGYRMAFQDHPSGRPLGHGRDLAVRRRDGTLIPVEIGLNPVEVDGEVHAVVSLVDLSERKRANEKIQALADELTEANRALERLAVTDGLTGLWNRRKFFEEAERLLKLLQQTGGPFSLLLLDVDDFKDFNDHFGHPEGDDALRRVAGVLGELRSGSDISARYGGEEFIVGLPGTDATEAAALSERLRDAVSRGSWEGRPITVSVGVATLSAPGERGTPTGPLLARLVEDADRALYRSKAAGKNRVTHCEWASRDLHPPVSRDVRGGETVP